ncbi:voltage-gated chloride channel [Nautilia sp. PV-1]|uniref:chloride channel protein n=1 Tax=Nautilia sp. PV-1 TaxID=2579250 RepID=UPI000FDC7C20|nr:chloride channel protein [Nautilia sp. PV-1]AZV46745.1 voltage-gated chloride channel [Nautilia sp. PV-1]
MKKIIKLFKAPLSKFALLRDFLLASILTGFLSGIFVVIYDLLAKIISRILYKGDPISTIPNLPVWYVFIIPIISILIVNFIISFDKSVKEYGVSEIAEIVSEEKEMITIKNLFLKIIASAISIGSGFSMGNEGPSAAIGAMIAYKIHHLLKFPANLIKPLISVGASSGIAAIFVSPITGIAFAIESIAYNFVKSYISFIIVGSLSAFTISVKYLDSFTFVYSAGRIIDDRYIYLTAAFIPFITFFIYLYLTLQDKILYVLNLKLFNRFGKFKDIIFAIIGGSVIALILIISPYAGFTGHNIVTLLINSEKTIPILFIVELLLLRIFATSFSIYSNAIGGMFVPLMSIGALVGYLFGEIVFKMHIEIEPFYFAAIGAAVFMGVLMKLPLTSIVLALEITNDYNVVVATGVSVAIISYLTRLNFNIKKFNTININFSDLKIH